ncbi:MAG: three-Cys-motif partner protein TcmP [Rhizomicrobium sp.]
MIDPDDGLVIAEDVGEWSLEKHERLRKYVDITRETRRKYADGARFPEYHGGATYIDLFCGPGRARIRESGHIVDGSPLVAFKSAVAGGVPFSEIHLADLSQEFNDAAVQRIANAGGTAFGYVGPAEVTAREVVSHLNPHGLHFAFLDPYNLAGLSFDVIRTLAALKRIDLLMHVSVQDMQRNSDRYTTAEHTVFDVFAPGWRSKVDTNQRLDAIRAAVLEHWRTLIAGLGFLDIRSVELVRGSQNQRLYWLAFASRHKIANEFWDKIRNISGQREFKL